MGSRFKGGASPSPSGPDDFEGWRARRAAGDAGIVASLREIAALGASVQEITVGAVIVYDIVPNGIVADDTSPIYLFLHGGGLYLGGGEACRLTAEKMAAVTGLRVWAVDYRMPPEHPYPTPLEDCLAVYRGLLDVRAPECIAVGGASAGGNLAAALVLRARDEGLRLPAALVLQTPELDLTESGDSFATNLGIDSVLVDSLMDANELYAAGHDLTDPYLSPLFGDFIPGFPPTFLQAGTRDLFLSNAVRMHRKLRAAGVEVDLHVFEAMPHGGFFGAPEDLELEHEIRTFIAHHVGRPAGS
jgi:monoterpene epsilon-lactone hydrolase